MSKHGEQFSEDRYENAGEHDTLVTRILTDVFQAHNVISVEPEQAYDNYKEEKALHQVIDYAGCDFVVDTFSGPPFGVNHRVHTPTDSTLRFDLRSETGTEKTGEYEYLLESVDNGTITPKYATRLKESENDVAWVRVVDLQPLLRAVKETCFGPQDTWTGPNSEEAVLFEYDTLRSMDCLIAEFGPGTDWSQLGRDG